MYHSALKLFREREAKIHLCVLMHFPPYTVPIICFYFAVHCRRPLGMEHGHIADEDISASSSFDFKSVGPHNAR